MEHSSQLKMKDWQEWLVAGVQLRTGRDELEKDFRY
jgi:hypothetical protein